VAGELSMILNTTIRMMIHIMRIEDRRSQIHVTIKKADYYHMNRKSIKMLQTEKEYIA
jgi:hypothetical protein